MGCCFSSSTTTRDPKPHCAPAPAPPPLEPRKTPSPPPQPAPEEETVKEVVVLSEKHVALAKQPESAQVIEDLQAPVKCQRRLGEGEISDVSQTSEVPSNSVTETFSTATTATTATVKEDEVTSRESRVLGQKSPAKTVRKRAFKGEQGTGRAKRVEASAPEKRARGRGWGRGSGEVRTAARNVGSRSRSLPTGRAGGIRRSSGKVGEKGEARRMPMSADGGESGAKRNPAADAKNDVVPEQVGNESLELECFIFL